MKCDLKSTVFYLIIILLIATTSAKADLSKEYLDKQYTTSKGQELSHTLECLSLSFSPDEPSIMCGILDSETYPDQYKIHIRINVAYTSAINNLLDTTDEVKCRATCENILTSIIGFYVHKIHLLSGISTSAITDYSAEVVYSGESSLETAALYEDGKATWLNACGDGQKDIIFKEGTMKIASYENDIIDYTDKGAVLEIIDCNTVRINNTTNVKLLGIECVTSNDEDLDSVIEYLESKVLIQVIRMEIDSCCIDDESKMAYIYVKDVCINEEMIRLGLMKVTDDYAFMKRDKFKQLEDQAKKEKLGIWK
ncbi:MAG: thermonuclease family protein [candidate division Zixibacteria bacterium]|nr:thermonuclease family protein [candidate division Zixibacteria bacterium]